MKNQNRIHVLDCTLRDGGCVNDFQFGTRKMKRILETLETSGVSYVELGYLDEKKGSQKERTEYSDVEAIIRNHLLDQKKAGITYLAMIDYGKYPADLLPECTIQGLDGIRLCFHKQDRDEAIRMGQEILKKGYQLLLQPMVCTRYSEEEFRELLEMTEERLKGVSAFYIVDSFGAMSIEEILGKLQLADRILNPKIALGLHMHNNRGLAFSGAVETLEFSSSRNVIVDGTVFGIGKGAGNLCTEEITGYLNQEFAASYDVEGVKKLALEEICPMQQKYKWGCRPEYGLSAKYCLSPSYAKLFRMREGLELEEVEELLKQIPDDKKDSFDPEFAERLLMIYRKNKKGSDGI